MCGVVHSLGVPYGLIVTDLQFKHLLEYIQKDLSGSLDGKQVFINFITVFVSIAQKLYYCCHISFTVFCFF